MQKCRSKQMRNISKTAAVIAGLACAFVPAAAAAFDKIDTREQFIEAIQGKDLRITGISVNVTPAGQIKGRAFGIRVQGEWEWQDGYFCRSLFWGRQDLGPNCQEVKIDGDTIRFTSDRGAGEFADLTMR
jgi:hypothetical protein